MREAKLDSGCAIGKRPSRIQSHEIVPSGSHRAKNVEPAPGQRPWPAGQEASSEHPRAAPLSARRTVERVRAIECWSREISWWIHRHRRGETDFHLAEGMVGQVAAQDVVGVAETVRKVGAR